MHLILTRHAKTIENEMGIAMGQAEGHLSEEGKEDSKKLGEKLKNEKIDVIITSDLKRCVETAKAIASHHPKAIFILDPILRERDIGIYTLKPRDSIPGGVYSKERFEGGESLEDVRKRVEKFFKRIKKEYKNKRVLVVTHGIILRLLVGYILGKNIDESVALGRFDNATITEIEINRRIKVKRFKENVS